jgi:hypothetical protein
MSAFLKTPIYFTIGFGVFADPCTRLCKFDGPEVCTDGSYTKNGDTCHNYVYRGDRLLKDYCYHTHRTKEVCPGSGAPVRPDEVESLISDKRGTTTKPDDFSTTIFFATTEKPELPLEMDGIRIAGEFSFRWTQAFHSIGGPHYLATWFRNIVANFDRSELSTFVDFAYGDNGRNTLRNRLVPPLRVYFESTLQTRVTSEKSFIGVSLYMSWYNSEDDMRKALLDAMSEYSGK